MIERLLLVGGAGGTHVAGSLLWAAHEMGMAAELADTSRANDGPKVLRRVSWHLLGRRPLRLPQFGREVVDVAKTFRPDCVFATGNASLDRNAVRELRETGARVVNWTTDDPWSPNHRAPWALAALKEYDLVFSPRRSSIEQLGRHTGGEVRYLPFGYDPRWCFPETSSPQDSGVVAADLVFVGGADAQRVEIVRSLMHARVDVALYGGFWDRFPEVRRLWRGHAGPDVIRRATTSAKVALCLVRRSNRDGHVMRTFEMAAMGACMLVEDTVEHRDIFGDDGDTVRYFRDNESMVGVTLELIADAEQRRRLGQRVERRIRVGGNTYQDRLAKVLSLISSGAHSTAGEPVGRRA